MRRSKSIFVIISLLMGALILRAAISATMPIQMMGVANAANTTVAMEPDCPGHRAMQADAQSGSGSAESSGNSCAWCGECCVSAPLFTFNPDQTIFKIALKETFARLAVPRLAYLTPGLYRPPAA